MINYFSYFYLAWRIAARCVLIHCIGVVIAPIAAASTVVYGHSYGVSPSSFQACQDHGAGNAAIGNFYSLCAGSQGETATLHTYTLCRSDAPSICTAITNFKEQRCVPNQSWDFQASECTQPRYYLAMPLSPGNELGQPKRFCPVGDPINPATGNEFYVERSTVALGAAGRLSFDLYYNSMSVSDNRLGVHWQHEYSSKLTFSDDPVRFPPSTTVSGEYATAPDACLVGWSEVKQAILEAWVSDAGAVFTDQGRCQIVSGGNIVTTLPIIEVGIQQFVYSGGVKD